MRNLLAAALLASAALVAVPAQAQSTGADIHAGELELAINKSQIVTADRVIDRAMIGNDTIADVLPVSDRSIYILGKSVGTTSLTLYDKMNRVIAVMDISVGPDVEALRLQLDEMFPGQTIDARLTNGKLVLNFETGQYDYQAKDVHGNGEDKFLLTLRDGDGALTVVVINKQLERPAAATLKIGNFAADVANLSRIVTLHGLTIAAANTHGLGLAIGLALPRL